MYMVPHRESLLFWVRKPEQSCPSRPLISSALFCYSNAGGDEQITYLVQSWPTTAALESKGFSGQPFVSLIEPYLTLHARIGSDRLHGRNIDVSRCASSQSSLLHAYNWSIWPMS